MARWYCYKRLGPLNYLIKIGDRIKKVHIDHLLPRSLNNELSSKENTENWEFLPLNIPTEEVPANVEPPVNTNIPSEGNRRYPQRTRVPVKRFELIEL